MPEPPVEIPNFVLGRCIGEGGMGFVYLAEQQRPRRPAAVKIIAPESGLPAALLESLRQEGDIAARFQHPNLVTVFECGIIDGHYYLAMEYLPGGDLERKIQAGLSEREAVHVIADVAAALGHIHHKGFVHRDIKPSNVMFTEDGRTILADFGIAKSIDSVGPMTKLGYSTGTPAYMSPEQVHGDPIDQRSDLYSLGVMLYQLLSGRLPFAHDNDFDLREAHVRETPPPLPESRSRFQGIVDRLLAKDPVDRFPDAQALIDALERIDVEGTRVGPVTGEIPEAPPSEPALELRLGGSDSQGLRVSEYFRRHRRRRLGWIALALAALAAYWLGSDRPMAPPAETEAAHPAPVQPSPVEPAPERSIAVLPFVNMSDAEDDYFSDGISEELLNALVRIPGLKVVGRTSSFAFKGRTGDLREIGRQLNAAYLLEGSVRKVDDRVRITAQLIRADTGYHEWSETFDRTLDDIFAVQEEISLAIASRLGAELAGEELARITRPATRNVQAYDLYLRGQAAARQARSPDDYQQAIELFDQALRRDPTFAEAEAAKCLAYHGQYDETRDTRFIDAAVDACDRAATMDPDQAAVHLALGRLYVATGRLDFALPALRRALDLDPDSDTVHRTLADALARSGDLDSARSHFEQAIALRPDTGRNYSFYAAALVRENRFEEAAEQFQAAIRAEPDNYRHYTNLGGVLYYLGRFAMAGAAFQRSIEHRPNGFAFNNAATNYYYAGDYDSALDMARQAVAEMPHDYRFQGSLADICRWVESCRSEAIEHYREALARVDDHLRVNPADATAAALRAWYLVHLDRDREADAGLERALDMEGDNIDVLLAAALVAATSGDHGRARALAERLRAGGYPSAALRADPDLRASLTVAAEQ